MKLTKKIIEDAKPAGKELWLWDSQLPGFGVRVKPSGHRSYVIQYRDEARRTRRLTIGRHGVLTTEEARWQARQLLAAVARGESPAQERREAREAARTPEPTMEDLCRRYLAEWAEVRKKPKSIKDDQQKIDDYILRAWRNRPVASITRRDVDALRVKLKDRPIQANRVLALLSKMMNLAEVWEWRPDGSNPVRHVERYRETKRQRYLTEKELARLGEALRAREAEGEHPPAVLAVLRLLFTGARTSEILTLRWQHVDLQRGLAHLPDSKTGAKTLIFGPPVVQLLQDAKKTQRGPWVCPGQGGGRLADLKTPWRKVKEKVDQLQDKEQAEGTLKKRDRVDLSDLRLHDLRHAFASSAAGQGVSLHVIGGLLGHAATATTARYAHLATSPLQQAAAQISGHIAAVLNGAPEGEVVDMPLSGEAP